MVCSCYLLFQATYFIIVIGYPLKSLYLIAKNGERPDKKWIYYFFVLSLFYFCELTVLFPLKWLLSKICFCMFPTVKAVFALWLYYPQTQGLTLIEGLVGDKLDMAFLKINPIIGGFMQKINIPNRDSPAMSKKNE